MSVGLRPYQIKLEADTYAAWNTRIEPSNAMVAAATGSGKTRTFSKLLLDYSGQRGALVHRQELVSQISLTLGGYGVRHRIIAPPNVRRMITSLHIAELNRDYTDPNAKCFVAGVDTLLNQPIEPWMKEVGLIVPDEAHHVLRENKWGKSMGLFPKAYGFMPTATPCRADGKGLGRHHDGLADHLVLAPEMRDIINMGYLTDYDIVLAETTDIRLTSDDITPSGDFSPAKASKAHAESKQIVGDVVETYLAYARGKLGITFATDVDEAVRIARGFRDAGVPAEVVHGKTPDALRVQIVRRFKNRELLQLVNVDLFGEGFDLPALEVVSFARHTASFSLYCQQFGRALRLMVSKELSDRWDSFTDAERRWHIANSAKPKAIIIDHVGNIMRHFGTPDARWRAGKWTLDRREKGVRGMPSDAEALKMCLNKNANNTGLPCAKPYEAYLVECPHCHHHPVPALRSGPEYVEGNMTLLDADALLALRGEIQSNLEIPYISPNLPAVAQYSQRARHSEKLQQIAALKNACAWWGGLQTLAGRSDAEAHKRFYYKFGTDVWTAQTLDREAAAELYARVAADLAQNGVDATVNAGIHLLNY